MHWKLTFFNLLLQFMEEGTCISMTRQYIPYMNIGIVPAYCQCSKKRLCCLDPKFVILVASMNSWNVQRYTTFVSWLRILACNPIEHCRGQIIVCKWIFVVHALGILYSVNILCFCKLVGGESESAFFFYLWSVHIVKLLHTESTVNDPKDAISVVHVNKMLATVS